MAGLASQRHRRPASRFQSGAHVGGRVLGAQRKPNRLSRSRFVRLHGFDDVRGLGGIGEAAEPDEAQMPS